VPRLPARKPDIDPRSRNAKGRDRRDPALRIAHRGFVLESGHVVLSGTGAELLENQRVREAYLGL
jgi:hypothetical protein